MSVTIVIAPALLIVIAITNQIVTAPTRRGSVAKTDKC